MQKVTLNFKAHGIAGAIKEALKTSEVRDVVICRFMPLPEEAEWGVWNPSQETNRCPDMLATVNGKHLSFIYL